MMMNPASSSSDDNSSSSDSSVEGMKDIRKGGLRDGVGSGLEPVDSDDDDGSSDDGEYHGAPQHQVSNFDDLPTDDSEDESDSDDSDDSSVENQQRAGSSDDSDEDDTNQEDLPLSERVASRAQVGRRYYTGEDSKPTDKNGSDYREDDFGDGGKRRRAERKSRAIEMASQRLREARKEKGAKKKKQIMQEDGSSDDDDSSVEQASSKNNSTGSKGETKRKKKSKHAPTEMSSKRRDYFARGRPDLNSSGIGVSIGANKYKARDPRMISLSGHLDADVFEKRYGFLDDVQDQEIEQLKKRVNAWKKSGKKGQKERKKLGMTQGGGGSLEDDQEELTRLLQERAERKKANVVRAAKRSVKQKIREDVASGKRGAYYPKRSELKRMEAEAKYEEIRKRGGDEAVNKAIAKRRKKNVSKASKQMPSHMVS